MLPLQVRKQNNELQQSTHRLKGDGADAGNPAYGN